MVCVKAGHYLSLYNLRSGLCATGEEVRAMELIWGPLGLQEGKSMQCVSLVMGVHSGV